MPLTTGQTSVGTAAVKIAGNYGYATTLHIELYRTSKGAGATFYQTLNRLLFLKFRIKN
jgi:hypothetical protein